MASVSASVLDWEMLETEHYRVYFHPTHEVQALETANELEINRPLVEKIVGNVPPKMPIVIEDYGHYTNGFASYFPLRINLMLNQASTSVFGQRQNFLRALTTHELTHAAHFTEISGRAAFLKRFFGNLLYPNLYSAGWMFEGLAVYVESQNSPFEGRLNDADMNAYFRQTGKENKLKTLGAMTLPFSDYLGGSTSYYYGARFTEYLAQTYGEDKLSAYVYEQGKRSTAFVGLLFPNLSLDETAKKVYGKSFIQLREDWVLKEKKEAQSWSLEGTLIGKSAWYKPFLTQQYGALLLTETQRYRPYPFYVNDSHVVKQLSEDGEAARLLYRSSRALAHPPLLKNDRLYMTHTQLQAGFENISMQGYGITHEIWRKNIKTKKKEKILTHPLSAFTLSPDNTIIFTNHTPGSFVSTLYKVEDEDVVELGQIDLIVAEIYENQGDYIILGKTQGGSWNIYKVETKSLELSPLFETAAALSSLHVSDAYVHFTATNKKTKHFYRLNRENNTVDKLSQGSYLNAGIETETAVLGLVIKADGEALMRQDRGGATVKTLPKNEVYKFKHNKEISKSDTAMRRNLKGILKPALYPLPLFGEDELGTLSYTFIYTPSTGPITNISTTFWRPWSLGIVSQYGSSYVSASRPLYKSLSMGLSRVDLGILSDLKESNYFSWSASYAFRNHTGSLQGLNLLRHGESSVSWKDRHSYKDLAYTWTLHSTQGLSAINYIRGFVYESISNASGTNVSLDLTARVISFPDMNTWSPSVAIGSIYAGAFLDSSSYSNQQAYGAYIAYEAKLSLLGLGLTSSIGESFSEGYSAIFIALEGAARF